MSVSSSQRMKIKQHKMETEEVAIFEASGDNVIDDGKFEEYKNEENVQFSYSNDEETESTEQLSVWSNICRVCANSNDHIIPIFEAEGAEHELSEKIHKYLPIRVAKTDTLPVQLCYHCAATILAWHELLSGCLNAEKQLLQMQSDQNYKEPTQRKYSENLSEEPIDDPEPTTIEKQESSSMSHQGEETEQCNLGEEATKRSGATRDTRFESFLKKETNSRMIYRQEERERSNVKEARNVFLGKQASVREVTKNVLSCDNCTRVFKRITNLRRHRENCRGKGKPTIEPTEKNDNVENFKETTSNKSDYREERDNSRRLPDYACAHSDHTTRGKKLLDLHTSEYHEEMGMGKRRKKLRTVDEEMIVRARMEANGRVYYHCKDCGKNLFSPYTFAWHVRIHTGERSFTCHLCGKQFRINEGLARHLRETHAGIKKFPCDICFRMFSTKRNVEDHRRIHTGERPFVCNICGKAFKQKASLFVHNRTHTDHFPFKCTDCNQGFRTRPPLVVHMTKHTGEKPYSCDVCKRAFRIKYELKRHRLVHSDEKPWQCADCGLGFRQKRYLVNHRRINHGSAKFTTNE